MSTLDVGKSRVLTIPRLAQSFRLKLGGSGFVECDLCDRHGTIVCHLATGEEFDVPIPADAATLHLRNQGAAPIEADVAFDIVL